MIKPKSRWTARDLRLDPHGRTGSMPMNKHSLKPGGPWKADTVEVVTSFRRFRSTKSDTSRHDRIGDYDSYEALRPPHRPIHKIGHRLLCLLPQVVRPACAPRPLVERQNLLRYGGPRRQCPSGWRAGRGDELRWRRAGAERALSLEDEVLGVEARGKEVVVRAFVVPTAAKSRSCVGVAGAGGAVTKRCRKEFVFEVADDGEGAAAAWAEKLRACLDSFGTCAGTNPSRSRRLSFAPIATQRN
jgi:hypothetical protein